MQNNIPPRLLFSIDEIALRLANIYDWDSIPYAIANGVIGIEQALEWRLTIKQHLLAGYLKFEGRMYVPFKNTSVMSSIEQTKNSGTALLENTKLKELDLSYWLKINNTINGKKLDPDSSLFDSYMPERLNKTEDSIYQDHIIPRDNLIAWSKHFDIKLWFDNGSSTTQSTPVFLPSEYRAIDSPCNELSKELTHIERLLNGDHSYQAPELATAIKVWLSAIDDPAFNHSNVIGGLEKYIPKDITANATRERIKKVANWNKQGNAK
jgi:hypothetical protein